MLYKYGINDKNPNGYQYTEEGSETKSEVNISIDDVFIPDNVRKLMASGVGNINSENGITFYY